jgi:hypothetical protein
MARINESARKDYCSGLWFLDPPLEYSFWPSRLEGKVGAYCSVLPGSIRISVICIPMMVFKSSTVQVQSTYYLSQQQELLSSKEVYSTAFSRRHLGILVARREIKLPLRSPAQACHQSCTSP